MYINLTDDKIKTILIKKINLCLKLNLITFKTYSNWIKLPYFFPEQNRELFKKINKFYLLNTPIYRIFNKNEPNFIILSSGQSNAGGWGSYYDSNNIEDRPNENILSYNVNKHKWVTANLEDDSLGNTNTCRTKGSNLFVFHFAKQLLKHYPGIRPGIINICDGGEPICVWTKFDKNEKYYNEYQRTLKSTNYEGYDLFNTVKKNYKNAMLQLSNYNTNKIDVVIWHQGETDYFTKSEPSYYKKALEKVIEQFNELNNDDLVPFISGTILDYYESGYNSDSINNIIRNMNDKLYNFAELSKLESTQDKIHFVSSSTRTGGRLYFEAYQKLMKKYMDEGIN